MVRDYKDRGHKLREVIQQDPAAVEIPRPPYLE